MLLGLMLLSELWTRRLSLTKLVIHAVPAGLVCLGKAADMSHALVNF